MLHSIATLGPSPLYSQTHTRHTHTRVTEREHRARARFIRASRARTSPHALYLFKKPVRAAAQAYLAELATDLWSCYSAHLAFAACHPWSRRQQTAPLE